MDRLNLTIGQPMQNSNYAFRMMFAIWDLETNLRPAEIEKLVVLKYLWQNQISFPPITQTVSPRLLFHFMIAHLAIFKSLGKPLNHFFHL